MLFIKKLNNFKTTFIYINLYIYKYYRLFYNKIEEVIVEKVYLSNKYKNTLICEEQKLIYIVIEK